MASTASARLTVGALFGAVTTAANSVTALLDVTTDGVGMISTFVGDAATKQSLRSLVDMHGFEAALQEEKAQEMSVRQMDILKFVNQSADHKVFYETNYNNIGKILADRKQSLAKAA